MTIYNQIYKSMLKLITSGSWKIGKQLPSENFLKQHYKVNRLTIRKALEILANENLIIKKKGSRAKVISRRPVPKVYFSTSLDDPVLKKKRWSIIVEFTKKRSTSSKRFLNENIFQIRRYFYDNETPSYIATSQVLIESVPDLNEKVFNLQKFNNASLSEILTNKYSFKIHNQKITSNSVILTKEETDFFDAPKNSAGTKWVSFYFDINDHLLFIDTEISLKNINIELYNKDLLKNEKI